MEAIPKKDQKAFHERINQTLDGLESDAITAFAIRCAWRSAPLLAYGWEDLPEPEHWLQHNLSKVQTSACAALLKTQPLNNIRIPNAALSLIEHMHKPDSRCAYAALEAIDDATIWARAVWVATPLTAAAHSINAYTLYSEIREDTEIVSLVSNAMHQDIESLRSGMTPAMLFFEPIFPASSRSTGRL